MKNRKSNGYYTVSYQQIDILHPYIIVRYMDTAFRMVLIIHKCIFFVIKCRFRIPSCRKRGVCGQPV